MLTKNMCFSEEHVQIRWSTVNKPKYIEEANKICFCAQNSIIYCSVQEINVYISWRMNNIAK